MLPVNSESRAQTLKTFLCNVSQPPNNLADTQQHQTCRLKVDTCVRSDRFRSGIGLQVGSKSHGGTALYICGRLFKPTSDNDSATGNIQILLRSKHSQIGPSPYARVIITKLIMTYTRRTNKFAVDGRQIKGLVKHRVWVCQRVTSLMTIFSPQFLSGSPNLDHRKMVCLGIRENYLSNVLVNLRQGILRLCRPSPLAPPGRRDESIGMNEPTNFVRRQFNWEP